MYSRFSHGANIAGRARIEDLCYIGMGAVISDEISVGSNSVIGAAAVVTKDVPGSVQVMATPARITKEIRE